MITGHCECEKISFEANCEVSEYSHCHCSQCRRLHGAAYASFAKIELKYFKYLSNTDLLSSYASSGNHERIFCSNCGSNIMVILADYPETVYVAMGVINGDPKLPEPYHIYVGSKAPWHEILDDCKQYNEEPFSLES